SRSGPAPVPASGSCSIRTGSRTATPSQNSGRTDMRLGFAGNVARSFLDSKLTPLVVAASLGLGAIALLATPREEEPQIRVPMVDVMVAWPGAEPAEVESRIVAPIERMLWGVPGVEHIYSVSRPGMGMVSVRFKVNE